MKNKIENINDDSLSKVFDKLDSFTAFLCVHSDIASRNDITIHTIIEIIIFYLNKYQIHTKAVTITVSVKSFLLGLSLNKI